jgi:serine/threonine protein kinase
MVLSEGQGLQRGKYIVKRKLKHRQYDITYLAERSDGTRWVIKILDPVVLAALNPEERNRLENLFLQEAFKIAECSGTPHIVKVEMPFKEETVACLPMEYLGTDSLADRPQRIFSEANALEYIRQIGEALTIVHQQGIIHRDICPENIFLRLHHRKVEAVLTDFGLALGVDAMLSRTRENECREGFSPIELYSSGKPVGAYTDVYALAATLYELLTGEIPVSADDRQFNRTNLDSPQVKNPNISGKTTKAILAGMELLPEKRPQSVQAWLEKLPVKETSDRTVSTAQIDWGKWGTIWGFVGVVVAVLFGIIQFLPKKSDNSSGNSLKHPPVQSSPYLTSSTNTLNLNQ